jgi:SAM-dependent methyltransferase
MNPFAAALRAYHRGHLDACFTISRDDGFAEAVPMSVFFEDGKFSELESKAIGLCGGSVLDVGAGAGRHSLALRRRGRDVTALEIEPECEAILRARGLAKVIIGDVMAWSGERFDTVLMLMNGIGMVGTPEKLDRFLATLPSMLQSGGRLLCDSIDVNVTENPVHVAYREANVRAGRYPGQQFFSISFGGERGELIAWLHIEPDRLAFHCAKAGLTCEVVVQERDGHYLARIAP